MKIPMTKEPPTKPGLYLNMFDEYHIEIAHVKEGVEGLTWQNVSVEEFEQGEWSVEPLEIDGLMV